MSRVEGLFVFFSQMNKRDKEALVHLLCAIRDKKVVLTRVSMETDKLLYLEYEGEKQL